MSDSTIITLVASIGSSIVAIAVPIAVKLIDAYSQNKKIKLELYAQKQLQSIEKYVYSVHGDIMNKQTHSLSDSTRSLVMMYIKKSQRHYIHDIDEKLSNADFDGAADLLYDFCSQIKVPR